MSTTNSAVKLTHDRKSVETVVLFGHGTEIEAAKKKIEKQGRSVQLQARPSFDTGTGMCGSHLCHCKEFCKAQY